MERPDASRITDNQLDALWDALDEIAEYHRAYGPLHNCFGCGAPSPCYTLRIISRQRSKALEDACPEEPEGP